MCNLFITMVTFHYTIHFSLSHVKLSLTLTEASSYMNPRIRELILPLGLRNGDKAQFQFLRITTVSLIILLNLVSTSFIFSECSCTQTEVNFLFFSLISSISLRICFKVPSSLVILLLTLHH